MGPKPLVTVSPIVQDYGNGIFQDRFAVDVGPRYVQSYETYGEANRVATGLNHNMTGELERQTTLPEFFKPIR